MKKTKTPTLPTVELDHKLYILMRNDMPSMNPGKAMAQAAHASNQFVKECPPSARRSLKEWQEDRGFGTTVVLGVDIDTLARVSSRAAYLNEPQGLVYDKTYPFIVNSEIAPLISHNTLTAPSIFKDNGQVVMFRNEITCGYIFIREDSPNQLELVGDLPLHP